MGAVAQVASCASNLAYLIVFRSKKTREAANKTFDNHTCHYKRRVKRIGKRAKRIGHDAWCKKKRMWLLAAIFTLTLTMNTWIISAEGMKYAQKSIHKPLRQWRNYNSPFKAVLRVLNYVCHSYYVFNNVLNCILIHFFY